MRFRLRTLVVLTAIGPPALAWICFHFADVLPFGIFVAVPAAILSLFLAYCWLVVLAFKITDRVSQKRPQDGESP